MRHPEKLPRWVALTVLVCATASCYFVLRTGFVDDDFIQLWNARFPLWDTLLGYFSKPDMFADAYFRPLTRVIHRVFFELFGASAVFHHTISVGTHLLNVVLLYLIVQKLQAPEHVARLSAIVFAIHPVHVEPIASVSALGGLLSCLSLFLALLAYMRYLETSNMSWGLATASIAGLGLLCKEEMITIPLSLGVLWWYYGSQRRRQWWPIASIIPLIGGWFLWRVLVGSVLSGSGDFTTNPLTLLRNLQFHLSRLIVSVRAMFHAIGFDGYYQLRDWLPATPDSAVFIVLVLLGATVAGGLVWRFWRTWPRFVKTGFLLMITTMLVYLPLQASATRFLYIPVAGFAVGVVGLLFSWQSRVRRIVLILWLLLLSVSLVDQTFVWYQTNDLVEHILGDAVRKRQSHNADIGTVFEEYPTRHYGAGLFATGLSEAIRWRTGRDWQYLYTRRDDPPAPHEPPDSLVWYLWDNDQFVPTAPRNR